MLTCAKIVCTRPATLTGDNNGGSFGPTHLCTRHMREAQSAYRFWYVWPCMANNITRYPSTARAIGGRALTQAARTLCRD